MVAVLVIVETANVCLTHTTVHNGRDNGGTVTLYWQLIILVFSTVLCLKQ